MKGKTAAAVRIKKNARKQKGNKRLYLSKNFLKKRQESYENILSEKGIQYRMNRSIQVEGAFGVLKKRLRIPEISAPRENESKTGDPFIVLRI